MAKKEDKEPKSNKYQYNSWPLPPLPEELQRPELNQLKELGYKFEDPREVIDIFEKKVAEFAGAKYAVSTDSCTHAIELSLRYLLDIRELKIGDNIYGSDTITIPRQTYISCALLIRQLGFNVEFEDTEWSGNYRLRNTRVVDAAVRWKQNMYSESVFRNEFPNLLYCLSFQIKKRIPIGRGGMILTDDEAAYKWLKWASYDGRDLTGKYDDPEHIKISGYHYYMTPEDAARAIILMDNIKEEGDSGGHYNYPPITNYKIFQNG